MRSNVNLLLKRPKFHDLESLITPARLIFKASAICSQVAPSVRA